jgi:hypothetical protein
MTLRKLHSSVFCIIAYYLKVRKKSVRPHSMPSSSPIKYHRIPTPTTTQTQTKTMSLFKSTTTSFGLLIVCVLLLLVILQQQNQMGNAIETEADEISDSVGGAREASFIQKMQQNVNYKYSKN